MADSPAEISADHCLRCNDHRDRIDLQARELCDVQVRLDRALSAETALRGDVSRVREQLARAESEMRDAVKMGQSMAGQLKSAMGELDVLKEKHKAVGSRACLTGPRGDD